MATAAELTEFIAYLHEQANIITIGGTVYGEPYVWGGQHLSLTPSNYEAVIHNREKDQGSYPDGTTYEEAAKAYCQRLFNAGLTQLYAYDCSGLGMYWLQNVKHIYSTDLSANNMMRRCVLYENTPARGWWLFKLNSSGRATHIGYMVDDTNEIEARGRKYGVQKRVFRTRDWDAWGIPQIWEGVIPAPGQPIPGTPPDTDATQPITSLPQAAVTSFLRIKVRGGRNRRVRVRKGPSTDYSALFTARGGDSFRLLNVSPATGWYKIETDQGPGYITNKTRYTEIIEEDRIP